MKTPFQKVIANGKKYLTDRDRSQLKRIGKETKEFLFLILMAA